jgi:hypothetical protein
VPAPTGSAKTENLITYCSLLPEGVTALISTNLISEADKIASNINREAGDERAYAFHSDSSLKDTEAANFQIVVVTHAFYRNHYSGDHTWSTLAENRDLLVIDEALETMKEISVEDTAIARAILIFSHLGKQKKFKQMPGFSKELQRLKDDLKILNNSKEGTNLISPDKMWTLTDGSQILSLKLSEYKIFSEILGDSNLDGDFNTSLNRLGHKTQYHNILTGINDKAKNTKIKEALRETIKNLNEFKDRQVYITANNGNKSFNRVTDMIFTKALVCFDATANVNEVYSLRSKYYGDIDMVEKVANVRNYANATLHTAIGNTGKDAIDIKMATSILNSVTLGKKTLVVTHKQNREYFMQAKENSYPQKTIEVAHWNAITGLNTWDKFDTCIVAGLNHKPKFYAQNRTIIHIGNTSISFGAKQNILNASIEDSSILVEIIQAINRIRVRKVIDEKGNCDDANIYIILPQYKDLDYIKTIKDEMPNINIKDWTLTSSTIKKGKAHADIVIEHLKNTLKDDEQTAIYEVRDRLGIKLDSYKSMLGSTADKKEAFKKRLREHGIEITESLEGSRGRKRKIPKRYYHKIGFVPKKS